MVQDVVTPAGPYRLRHAVRSGEWVAELPGRERARAWQQPDGRVVVQASGEGALARARFMLALDDDTSEFHARFARDPLLGASARALAGYRPVRRATVAHAAVRAVCGQLVTSREARRLERGVVAECGGGVPTGEAVAALVPARLCRLGLSSQRAAALVRLARGVDLERLHDVPSQAVVARICRERGLGPWSAGVICLEGLGRYDVGLVGDLSFVKLASSLWGRWVEGWETAELLAPYEEWQGLAGEMLLLGWARGLVPGADRDRARVARRRARRAA